MGYVTALGACWGCGQLFTFSPTRVPSVLVAGAREPICLACVLRANPLRAANGLPPIEPLPGAYEADAAEE